MGGWDCFAALAMTSRTILICTGSLTEPGKIHGHCEDPPSGGDEAISWSKVILPMGLWDCFAAPAMTVRTLLIRTGSLTEPGKIHGHCEDPPSGGDEAISWSKVILPMGMLGLLRCARNDIPYYFDSYREPDRTRENTQSLRGSAIWRRRSNLHGAE